MKNSLIILTAFFMIACAATQPENKRVETHSKPVIIKHRPVVLFTGLVEYFDENKTRISSERLPDDILLYFALVPGGVFGNPDPAVSVVDVVDASRVFQLDLSNQYEAFDSVAKPLEARWKSAGLVVQPESTKIGRMGTFAYDQKYRSSLGSAGFIEPDSNSSLTLIYVGQSCTITGSMKSGHKSYSHNLSFPDKGFYWVKAQLIEKNTYQVENYYEGHANFAIYQSE